MFLEAAIDTLLPADGVAASKTEFRGFREAVKKQLDDIYKIRVTPLDFAKNIVGDGTRRFLGGDYADDAAAIAAYPHIATEITDGDRAIMTHDWAAWQSACNYVQYTLTAFDVIIEGTAGRFMMDETLKVLRGDTFRSVVIKGCGQGYGPPRVGTTLDFSAVLDRPGVSIQGARVAVLEGLCIQGGNNFTLPAPAFYHKDISNYAVPGVTTGPFNSYVGVAIDPYTINPQIRQPGEDKYPNDPYADGSEGRVTSSTVFLTNCRISQFYVGIGISMSDHGSNADQIIADKCFMYQNAYQFSSGGSQNRVVKAINCYSYLCHTISTNKQCGLQDGNCFSIHTMTAVQMYNVIDWNESDPSTLEYVHAEQYARIGHWGGGPLQTALSMRNCHWKWFKTAGHNSPSSLLFAGGPAIFDGCHMQLQSLEDPFWPIIAQGSGRIVFINGSSWYAPGISEDPLIFYNQNGSLPPIVETSYSATGSGGQQSRGSNSVLTFTNGVRGASSSVFSMPSRVKASTWTHTVREDGRVFRYQPGKPDQGEYIGAGTNPVITGTDLQIDLPTVTDLLVDDYIGGKVFFSNGLGDDIAGYGGIGRVSAISGNTVTIRLLIDAEDLDPSYSHMYVVPHKEYAPKVAPTGTMSTVSNAVTFPSDVSGTFEAGDWVQGSDGNWGTGFRILTVAGDGLSITLNKNAPFTGATAMFWGRLYELVGTAQ